MYSSSFPLFQDLRIFFIYWDRDELLWQCKKRRTLKHPGCSLWQTMSTFNSLGFSDCNLTHMLEHLFSFTLISANSKMMEDWGQVFSCWFFLSTTITYTVPFPKPFLEIWTHLSLCCRHYLHFFFNRQGLLRFQSHKMKAASKGPRTGEVL